MRNEVMRTVQDQRVEAYVDKIVITGGMISSIADAHLRNGSDKNDLEVWVAELGNAAAALSLRIRDPRFCHQSALCDLIVEVAECLSRQLVLAGKDLAHVRQLTLALQVAVRSDDETLAATAIDVTVLVSAQGAAD